MKLIACTFQLIAVLVLSFPVQAQTVWHRRAAFRAVSSNPIELIDVGAATYVSSGDITPALPTTHASGDLLVLVWVTRLTAGATVPSGWTNLVSTTQSGTMRTVVMYKIDNGSESAPTVTSTTTDVVAAQIAAFRYVDGTAPLAAGTIAGGSITSPNTYTASATTVDNDGAVIVLASMNNDATGAQTLLTGDSLTWETIGDASTTLGSDISFSWQLGVGSGAISMTDKTIQRTHTGTIGQGVQIAIKPQ